VDEAARQNGYKGISRGWLRHLGKRLEKCVQKGANNET
jgi:hypothetical protein